MAKAIFCLGKTKVNEQQQKALGGNGGHYGCLVELAISIYTQEDYDAGCCGCF